MVIKSLIITSLAIASSVEPTLQHYVSDYYNLVDKYCSPEQYNSSGFYEVGFIILPPSDNTIAYCEQHFMGYEIQVNTTIWNTLVEFERRQLMYHELAHCVIYKHHVQDPGNYMYPFFIALPYDKYFPGVVKDIRDRCQK